MAENFTALYPLHRFTWDAVRAKPAPKTTIEHELKKVAFPNKMQSAWFASRSVSMWPELPGAQIPGEIREAKGERTDGAAAHTEAVVPVTLQIVEKCSSARTELSSIRITKTGRWEQSQVSLTIAERKSIRFRRNSRERTQRENIKCARKKRNLWGTQRAAQTRSKQSQVHNYI